MAVCKNFRLIALICFVLSACSPIRNEALPRGAAAYDVIPPADPAKGAQDYRISPFDTLSISVFQEPDLTFEKITVDASGELLFPLIGVVQARNQTPRQLSMEISARLGERYLRNPQVTVGVAISSSQKITVEGQVNEPGVYEISSDTSLLQALARAKSPTRTAKLDEVVVFRFVDGQRQGAVFDVAQIRDGRMADPQLLGGDVVVVGFSAVKGGFRDFLVLAPVLTLFRAF